MKINQVLALAGISMLAMSNSCGSEGDVAPAALTTGRLVRVENTIDVAGLNPRPRWTIDIAPGSLPGYEGVMYHQVKVFNLPIADTIYQAGQAFTFHYKLVPYDKQTPWRTGYEWHNARATVVGDDALPEITCSQVEVIQSTSSK